MAAKKGGMGLGLDSIFMDSTEDSNGAVTVKISEIEPNPGQPRKDFDMEALTRLSESIALHGVIQPLLVRPQAAGPYQIVAGERRWRAANMAGLRELPVIIRELSDKEVSELALIENLQREDLNAIEEAEGYRSLIDNYGMTQEVLSDRIGKSRTVITNALRLLNLPAEVTQMVREGELTNTQARTILSFKTPELMLEMAKLAVKEELTVRKLEELAKRNLSDKKGEIAVKKDKYFKEVEIALEEHLGRKVKIREKNGRGSIAIEFFNSDDLAYIAKLLDTEGR